MEMTRMEIPLASLGNVPFWNFVEKLRLQLHCRVTEMICC